MKKTIKVSIIATDDLNEEVEAIKNLLDEKSKENKYVKFEFTTDSFKSDVVIVLIFKSLGNFSREKFIELYEKFENKKDKFFCVYFKFNKIDLYDERIENIIEVNKFSEEIKTNFSKIYKNYIDNNKLIKNIDEQILNNFIEKIKNKPKNKFFIFSKITIIIITPILLLFMLLYGILILKGKTNNEMLNFLEKGNLVITISNKIYNLHGYTIFRTTKFVIRLALENINTKLLLNDNILNEIPSDVYNLIDLEELDLGNNNLLRISKKIKKLKKLTLLRLWGNQLTSIPKEILTLTNLNEFDLSENKLTILSKEIGNLVNLKELSLWGNNIKKLPKNLQNLNNLEDLDGIKRKENESTKAFFERAGYEWEEE